VNECLADGIFYVLRHNELSWYGHVFLWKNGDDWVQGCELWDGEW